MRQPTATGYPVQSLRRGLLSLSEWGEPWPTDFARQYENYEATALIGDVPDAVLRATAIDISVPGYTAFISASCSDPAGPFRWRGAAYVEPRKRDAWLNGIQVDDRGDSIRVQLPEAPDSYAAEVGLNLALLVTAHGDLTIHGGGGPARQDGPWPVASLSGTCGKVDVTFSPSERVLFTGTASELHIDAGEGGLEAELYSGQRLESDSILASATAAAVRLPEDFGGIVQVPANWSVLCSRTNLYGCGQEGPVDIRLGGGSPTLTLRAPRGILIIEGRLGDRALPSTEACESVPLHAALEGLTRADVKPACYDAMNRECIAPLEAAAELMPRRIWPIPNTTPVPVERPRTADETRKIRERYERIRGEEAVREEHGAPK